MDKTNIDVSFKLYLDGSAGCAADAVLETSGDNVSLAIPANAVSGDKIHIVVKAQNAGYYKLVHYQQIIVTVK